MPSCCRRSRKIEEIAHCPWAEVAWYLPQTREQFRFLGRLTVVDAATEDAALQRVSRHAAAWPRCPGPTHVAPPARHVDAVPPPSTCPPGLLLPLLPMPAAYPTHVWLPPASLQGRLVAWKNMSDPGRQQFLWPHPGEPRGEDASVFKPGVWVVGCVCGGGESEGGGRGSCLTAQPSPFASPRLCARCRACLFSMRQLGGADQRAAPACLPSARFACCVRNAVRNAAAAAPTPPPAPSCRRAADGGGPRGGHLLPGVPHG